MAKKNASKPAKAKDQPSKPPKPRTSKAPGAEGVKDAAPVKGDDMDSAGGKNSAMGASDGITKAESALICGRESTLGPSRFEGLSAAGIESILASARDQLMTLLMTANGYKVSPELKAKAGAALVDALRFFVSDWKEGTDKATLNPNFPKFRSENAGFNARYKQLYPRARHDAPSRAAQVFIESLWWKLHSMEFMSAEITLFGAASPCIFNGKSLPLVRFKAFDKWAAKVNALSGIDETTRWNLETHLSYARASSFESYWREVVCPIAKEKHIEALNDSAKADARWREIAKHAWRGTVEKWVKRHLRNRLTIMGGTKVGGSFIW